MWRPNKQRTARRDYSISSFTTGKTPTDPTDHTRCTRETATFRYKCNYLSFTTEILDSNDTSMCKVTATKMYDIPEWLTLNHNYVAPDPPPLPTYRLENSPPFTVTGIDFNGVLLTEKRAEQSPKLMYVCLHAHLLEQYTWNWFMISQKSHSCKRLDDLSADDHFPDLLFLTTEQHSMQHLIR